MLVAEVVGKGHDRDQEIVIAKGVLDSSADGEGLVYPAHILQTQCRVVLAPARMGETDKHTKGIVEMMAPLRVFPVFRPVTCCRLSTFL